MNKVNLLKIFIASPGDVWKQRDEVEKLIWDWNNNHVDSKNTVLMPIRWENNTSSSYKLNSSGQAIINEQIVKSSDILIAIFGDKIGTLTSNNKSGTVEEINVFYEEHKDNVGIFFVKEIKDPNLIKERQMVEQYKKYIEKKKLGLYQKYTARNINFFINNEVEKKLKDISYRSNNETSVGEIQNNIETDLFNHIEFDVDELLLLIYIVEDSKVNLGSQWNSDYTRNLIREWEEKNNLINYISESYRYDEVLEKLEEKGFIGASEENYDGYPLTYRVDNSIYRVLKRTIYSNTEEVNEIKKRLIKESTTNYEDLPF